MSSAILFDFDGVILDTDKLDLQEADVIVETLENLPFSDILARFSD